MVWILRYLGVGRSSVLDGGLGAWRGAGESAAKDSVDPRTAFPATLAPAKDWTVPWDEMVDRFADTSLTIVDVRTDDEADDDLNGLLHRGMIPNSIRLPWTNSLRDQAGRLLAPEALGALFRNAGVLPEDEVAVVARFGVEAGQTWLVLSLLGYERVRIFDRGWANWGRKDTDVPIAELAPL
jgi:thiosulfate/3-mercaptopyruvate sulfurtransferase